MQWVPPKPETVQLCVQARFARGKAPAVHGLRSFRDSQRRDIQAELPGWPYGEPFAPHSPQSAREEKRDKRLGFAGQLLGGILAAVTQLNGPGVGGALSEASQLPEHSDDPANEVEDFPVLWADLGTVARDLPWQLDPRRSERHYETLLAVTEQRLLVLGYDTRTGAPEEPLWQTPLSMVQRARQMAFCVGGSDLRIDFADGSWTRLELSATADMLRIVPLVRRTARRVTEAELPEAQRAGVAKAISGFEVKKGMEPPSLILLPSGYLAAGVQSPDNGERGFTTQYRCVSPEGELTFTTPDDIT